MTLLDVFRSFLGLNDSHKICDNGNAQKTIEEGKIPFAMMNIDDQLEREIRMFEDLMKGLFSHGSDMHEFFEDMQPGNFIIHGDIGEQQDPGSLRDQVLKSRPDDDNLMKSPAERHWLRRPRIHEDMLPDFFRFDEPRKDMDYDESVNGNSLILDRLIEDKANTGPSSYFSSNSVSVRTITKPDGSVETERVERNSKGEEEIITTRSFGNQSQTTTKRIKADGSEEVSESFVNIDKEGMDKFQSKFS